MRNKNVITPLIVFLALLFAVPLYALADGGTPPSDDKRLKKLIKRGDNSYEQKNIRQALNFYGEAMKSMPDNAGLMYKTGICYMFMEKTDSAMMYFENAFKIDNGVSEDITFFLGRTKQLTGNYTEALDFYQAYLGDLNPELHSEQIAYTRRFIAECENATKFVPNNSELMRVINLGDAVNTTFPEYAPCITADGQMLIYTARRPEFGPKLRKQNSDYPMKEDIYIAKRLTDTTFTQAEKIGVSFNKRFNNASSGVSPDGKMLFVYNNKKNGNIYFSEYQADSTWSSMKEFGKGINTKHHESSATMTADSKTLYFVSDRPEGSLGRNDIWMSTLTSENTWSEPINAGSILNTPYDEESLYITPDGKTLYFSSQGHNSIGGFDIFKSEKDEKGNWSNPANIGQPINTPGDDVFFSMADSIGYFASVTGGGVRNFDIFAVKLLPPAPDTAFYAYVNLYIPEFKAPIIDELGKQVDTASFIKRTEIPMFGTIHFDFDKDKIKKESVEMLDLIYNFLQENPKASIAINGHTDNIGSYAYNLNLSGKRAKAAIKYLTDKGVDAARVNAEGFSFSKPIDTNKTSVGRAVNRRCEFQISNPE